MQKLTVPIARALANQVISKVQVERKNQLKTAEVNYKSSKEWKEWLKADEVVKKARKEREKITEKLKAKFKAPHHYLSDVYSYDDGRESYARFFSSSSDINAEELKDRILVENFQAENGETSTQIVDRLVTELTK